MNPGLDLSPVPDQARTASTLDVALLFAGANVVSSTLITGATLGTQAGVGVAATALLVGCVIGTAPIALLARLGPRTGLPSMVLLRQPFGTAGAAAISLLLVLTNFAWIALNNQVAANAFTQLRASNSEQDTSRPAAIVVGLLAVAVAAWGPRAMARFDRYAVPLMAVVGAALTVAVMRQFLTGPALPAAPAEAVGQALGAGNALDLVVGYQVSWALMFADYTRFQRRERSASRAVFLGLSLTSVWLMAIGIGAGRVSGTNDPAALLTGVGLPGAALLALGLATITTNFVNIYLSSLAVRTLWPKVPALPTVILVGGVGTLLSVIDPRLLDRYAGFMGLLATLLLPITAIALVHWFLPGGLTQPQRTATQPLVAASLAAWLLGAATFQALSRWPDVLLGAGSWGATLPTLGVAGLAYALLRARE